MTDEVDKINLGANTEEIDKAIDKLEKLEESMDRVDGKPVRPGIVDGAKDASDAVDDATENIKDDLEDVDEKLDETGDKIGKAGKGIGDVFKKATLTILGTAAAIGLASRRLNEMKANAVSAGISVQQAQVGGGAFEASGASAQGYTSALSQLRKLRALARQGEVGSEFLTRAARLGEMSGMQIGTQFLDKSVQGEDLADAIIKAGEIAAARGGDIDVIRENISVLLGEEFAQVFDYNQNLGRSWEELKSEFKKYAFISEEATRQNSELATEIQKTGTYFQSLTGELTGIFAKHFEKPLEDLNQGLLELKEPMLRLADFFAGRASEGLGEAKGIVSRGFEIADVNEEVGLQGAEWLLALPATFWAAIEKVPEAQRAVGEYILSSVGLIDTESLSEVPKSSLTTMEKQAQNVKEQSTSNSTQNNNGMTVNGPLINIEGNANKYDLNNAVKKAEEIMRINAMPANGVTLSE